MTSGTEFDCYLLRLKTSNFTDIAVNWRSIFDKEILNRKSVTHDGKCRGEEVGYSADLVEDADTGKKSIVCTNKAGACRRNICECDKRLAEQFALHEDSWNEDLHTNKGKFRNPKSTLRIIRRSEK